MKKRLVALVLAASLLVSMGSVASADQGGHPNENACHGQIVAFLASEWGVTPADIAKYFETNAGQVNKFIKEYGLIICS